ncbi:MAG TPA: tetratricopeptide repeat protein [Terriglobia bacterium]|nr:tetratricopeptide repeat protein [Terriglobia bacterium]
MSHEEACHLVRQAGGEPSTGVSRKTSFLIVGMAGWPLLADGGVASKLKRAEELRRRGCDIRILSEEAFLELLGRKNRQQPVVPKTHSAAEVCKRLKLSLEALQRWEQFGLIRPVEGLYDFQDLVSLRTIAELVERGVRPEVIAKSLQSLSSILPEVDRPLSQLKIVAQNPRALSVDLGESLMAPNGQMLINFDEAPRREATIVPLHATPSETEWFEYGQACEESEDYSEAVGAYRRAVAAEPRFAAAWFNLGNALRMLGQLDMAAEAYREASRRDAGMAAAWYNLADVEEEQGKIHEAVKSLQAALQANPSYADAHFNLALCYERLELRREAKRHWEAYLKLDGSSQWAKIARRHLAERQPV